jgi:hypothetical protein
MGGRNSRESIMPYAGISENNSFNIWDRLKFATKLTRRFQNKFYHSMPPGSAVIAGFSPLSRPASSDELSDPHLCRASLSGGLLTNGRTWNGVTAEIVRIFGASIAGIRNKCR